MKKIILIMFMFVTLAGFSQVTNSFVAFAPDSTVDAETVNLVITSPVEITKNHAVTITLVPVNVTGTATVTSMPQGSLDGVDYFDLQAVADTVNNAGTIATIGYAYPDANYRYYRFELVSTGSGETDFTGDLGLKKKYSGR
jgi:hypothetical protein